MIVRPSTLPPQATCKSAKKSASKAFLRTEQQAGPPFGIIFQYEHSILAGRLAQALGKDTFGELPAQMIQAASEHDFGWQSSDRAQMDAIEEKTPRPFPVLSAEETLPSWYESLAHAQSLGPLVYVLVSRHFTTLALMDKNRAEFVSTETKRRIEIERTLSYSASDLDRWTGAVGFSDLLSLYLCCGCTDTVEFPIAHPADPAAKEARKTTLSWENGSPRFSPTVVHPGTSASLDIRTYIAPEADLVPSRLEWHFA